MRNLFLLPKPNFKWLLSFCLVALLSLPSNSLLAQPSFFTISGCSTVAANGNYTRNATNAEGCPCYDNSNGGILYNFFGHWLYSDTDTCDSTTGGILLYRSSGCNISTATLSNSPSASQGCDPETTLCIGSAATCNSALADVPTLSEWGLIILALMFMTMGTLYLVQPNFRRGFEQK